MLLKSSTSFLHFNPTKGTYLRCDFHKILLREPRNVIILLRSLRDSPQH